MIFPVFFASTALSPLPRLSDISAVLAEVARLKSFSHAVELVRFTLYGQLETAALLTTALMAVAAMALAVWRSTAAASCAARSAPYNRTARLVLLPPSLHRPLFDGLGDHHPP